MAETVVHTHSKEEVKERLAQSEQELELLRRRL